MTGPHGAEGPGPILDPPQRVSGMRVPDADGWALPGKPANLATDAEDAWRQTGFLLSDDLRLIEAAARLQLRLAVTGYAPAARTMTMAAYASLWSRTFSSLADATSLVRRGAYQSALPLLRMAVEHIAAQAQLPDEFDAFKHWAHTAYGHHAPTRSEEVGVGHYFAGEAIASDEQLRVIYRAASDFARPNFGPTALFVAAEASHQRYPLIFADSAFHFGWAQLLLGWVLRLGAKQLHVVMHQREQFPAPPALRADVVAHVGAIDARLGEDGRCHLDEYLDSDGRRRHLLLEFRRQPQDASKRVLL